MDDLWRVKAAAQTQALVWDSGPPTPPPVRPRRDMQLGPLAAQRTCVLTVLRVCANVPTPASRSLITKQVARPVDEATRAAGDGSKRRAGR
jgi:hypothetical protein